MTTLHQARRLRKTSLAIVFLFIAAVAHSEIPENLQLRDDVSNDIAFTGKGCHSLQPHAFDEESAPTLGSGKVKVVPAVAVQFSAFPSVAGPFHLLGQDRLPLWCIQRT
jgi:hypothetical protein